MLQTGSELEAFKMCASGVLYIFIRVHCGKSILGCGGDRSHWAFAASAYIHISLAARSLVCSSVMSSSSGNGVSSAVAGSVSANPLTAARYGTGREGSSNLGTFQVCWFSYFSMNAYPA